MFSLTRIYSRKFKTFSVLTCFFQEDVNVNKKTVMEVTNKTGILLKLVIDSLIKFAPLHLAENWDNVGLLVEPACDIYVKNILLTNDLTEDVVKEAIENSTDLIVSYHPLIFPNVKCITRNSWKQRIISQCLMNRIAVFSPHTTWDVVKGGVNDWLISAFNVQSVKAIIPSKRGNNPNNCITIDSTNSDLIEKLMESENLSSVCYQPNETSASKSPFNRFVIHCKRNPLKTNNSDCSLDVVKYNVTLCDEPSQSENVTGVGRICELKEYSTINEVINIVKQHLNLTHVQVAFAIGSTLDTPIKTIAVCAGSGGSVLREVVADIKLSGEASHHDVLDSIHKGSSYILTHHSNSERGFLTNFKKILSGLLQSNEINIMISKKDRDPLSII